MGTLLLNIGGKINDSTCNGKVSIYDYELPKWYEAGNIECFRHVCWIDDHYLYVHGGLDNTNKILNNGKIMKYDLYEMFSAHEELVQKIKSYINAS